MSLQRLVRLLLRLAPCDLVVTDSTLVEFLCCWPLARVNAGLDFLIRELCVVLQSAYADRSSNKHNTLV